jgi:glycosyltransferase involved in cell wall biosynthesis
VSVRIGLLWPQTSALWTAGSIYFQNLLTALDLAGHGDDVVVIEPAGGNFASLKLPESRTVVTYRQRTGGGIVGRELDLMTRALGVGDRVAAAIKRSGVGVLFGYPEARRRLPVPWVGWVTDFQHHHYPEWFPEENYRGLDEAFGRVARESALVLLSSEDSHQDFDRFAPQFAEKARVVPFVSLLPEEMIGVDPELAVAKYRIARPFVVVANQWWRHKNHEVAIRAAAELAKRGEPVTWVMTGVLADYRDPGHVSRLLQLIAELGVESHVKILGVLPRTEQLQLMRAADAIVQPSLFEGWSTLVEDARTLGQRLVVSDIAIHREQEPASALFFDPASPEDLADRVRDMLGGACERVDERLAREQALERARVWGQRFYDVCAEAATRR